MVTDGGRGNYVVREIPLDGIAKAVVQVEFSPPNRRELELRPADSRRKGGRSVNIDMAALHAIEVDKGITVDVVLDTIKTALLTAYRHTEGHEAEARIDIDRKTGVGQGDGARDRRRRQPDQRMGRHPRGFRTHRRRPRRVR